MPERFGLRNVLNYCIILSCLFIYFSTDKVCSRAVYAMCPLHCAICPLHSTMCPLHFFSFFLSFSLSLLRHLLCFSINPSSTPTHPSHTHCLSQNPNLKLLNLNIVCLIEFRFLFMKCSSGTKIMRHLRKAKQIICK